MSEYKEKCPVCGRYELEEFDECPYCHWTLDGLESSTDENEATGGPMGDISVAQAKKWLAEGKDSWGDQLPKE